MGVQSPSKIKPPADCRGAQKKNVMQSMTRTSQQVRQGVLDLRENSMDELLHNVAQAELVHRIIMVLSFGPLLLIIPYGVPSVFIVTSIVAALIDLQFVIIQRYNRPRVIKLLKM